MVVKRKDPGAYRALWAFDREAYLAHLKRLTPADRLSRFQYAATDEQLERHVDEFLKQGGHLIDWFIDGELRAAAEVALLGDGHAAEGAFEVESPWRGRGVGAELVGRALLWARNRGARQLLIHTTRRNTAMLSAAKQRGATFEFDLADADGIIEAPKASWTSHLREIRFEESGTLHWLWDVGRRVFHRWLGRRHDGEGNDPAHS
jgi:GNAT superfamily N-acetyltransferase